MREPLLDMLFMKYFTIIYEFLIFLDRACQHFLTINTKISMPKFKVHNLFYHHTKAYFRYLWLMIWNEWYKFRYFFFIFKFLSFTLPTYFKVGVKDTCNKKIVNEKHPLLQYRLGLTQWKINSFEFKFDDTRLLNKIG